MGRWEKTAVVILLFLLVGNLWLSASRFYIAHTLPAPAAGGSYTEGLLGQPRLINPLLATSTTDQALIRLVYSGLYKYNGQGSIVPDLATGMPEISEDQKEYTVHIRPGSTWHSGRPLSADDVVYTIAALQDPSYKSPARSEWQNTSVIKIDDLTVEFKSKDVAGPFIHKLTFPILPKYIWSKIDSDTLPLARANLEAIGSGPYLIHEINQQKSGKVQSITLQSYSNYYGGKPLIETFKIVFFDTYEDVLNALHSREIEGFGFTPFDTSFYLDKNQNNLNILTLPLPQYQGVFFNLGNKLLSDKSVRTALAQSTDREAIISTVFGGNAEPISGPILPGQLGYVVPEKPIVDPTAAGALLERNGWKMNQATGLRAKGSQNLELTIATNDLPLNSKTAETLKAQWEQLGITVHLNILPTSELMSSVIRPRKFDVLLFAQKLGADPDPFAFWHSSQVNNPGLNLTGFTNAQVDKLITDARTTTNKEQRAADYQQFNQIISTEVPAIFLNQSVFIYAIDKTVKHTTLEQIYDPADRFYDVTNWYTSETRVWK
jgi:peptide/nickel transport system substrate-binding protein